MSQVLSGEKKDVLSSQPSTVEAYPENKEIMEEIRRLTQIINDKQRLIVGITQKLGEFIGIFRAVRKGIEDAKNENPYSSLLSNVEKYLLLPLSSLS